MEINSTLSHTTDIILENDGHLFLWSYGRTLDNEIGHFSFNNLIVQAGAK